MMVIVISTINSQSLGLIASKHAGIEVKVNLCVYKLWLNLTKGGTSCIYQIFKCIFLNYSGLWAWMLVLTFLHY